MLFLRPHLEVGSDEGGYFGGLIFVTFDVQKVPFRHFISVNDC